MAERTSARVSALAGHAEPGRLGTQTDAPGVILEGLPNLILGQVAAWPETLDAIGAKVADAVGTASAPAPGKAAEGPRGAALRIEPLKWWLVGAEAPALDPVEGASLDLSHSRSRVRISGPEAATLLNRHLPLDLRETAFPVGSVASTAFHHVGITLWHSEAGYELLLPRGFALSLWEMLVESAAQFGGEVRA